jgi:hypothetical protein
MAIQFSETARNARLDAIETTTGTSAVLKVFTGTQPATCATADSGTLLVNATLPSDWLAAASGGTKSKAGTWEDLSADGGSAATPGYFRIYASGGTVCHMQGSAGIGSGDMQFNGTITAGQAVTVTSFTITEANA